MNTFLLSPLRSVLRMGAVPTVPAVVKDMHQRAREKQQVRQVVQ